MKKVLILAGVTGTGKTALSLKLAEKLPIEIINADSVSVYRDMDIGSAKVGLTQQKLVIHHLVDFLNCDENFDVSLFQKEGRKLIEEITQRNHLPVVVGGTGLYINALVCDYRFDEEKAMDLSSLSSESLWKEIEKHNPRALANLHINNRIRLERAVMRIRNHSETSQYGDQFLYDAKCWFLYAKREILYNRINKRVDQMMQEGLFDEVKGLVDKYPDFFSYSSSKAIGYREFKDYFKGEKSLEETVEEIKKHTRQFAKRQITWFKNKTASVWVDIEAKNALDNLIEESVRWYYGEDSSH